MKRPAFKRASAAIAPAPVAPGQPLRVEHEYRRHGAWAYLAAWDVHRARVFGRCEPRSASRPLTGSSSKS